MFFAKPLQRSNLCASHRQRRWLTHGELSDLLHLCNVVVVAIQVCLQHPEMLVTCDASVVLLRLHEGHGRPAQRHLSVLPVGDATCALPDSRVRRIDDVRRREARAQCSGQAEPIHGEDLIEAFSNARCCIGPVALEPRGVLVKLAHALLSLELPGGAQGGPCLVVLRGRSGRRHSAACGCDSAVPRCRRRTPGRSRCVAPSLHRRRTADVGRGGSRERRDPRAGRSSRSRSQRHRCARRARTSSRLRRPPRPPEHGGSRTGSRRGR